MIEIRRPPNVNPFAERSVNLKRARGENGDDEKEDHHAPREFRQLNVVNRSIEIIVFGKNQNDDQQHVEVVRIPFVRQINDA